MPSKFQTTVAMVEYTAKDVSSRPEVFAEFLTTAANNYKYSFRDQLLIFAQKPNAVACAEIEVWNKLGRYVNKGTKGIALLVDRNVPYKLRHVFDITDTNSYYGNEVSLWRMKPEYEDAVSEALQNSFGELDGRGGFTDVLMGIAELAVTDNISDYAVIPDNDSSYNFIVGMLYTQLFQQLYYSADVKHGGRLPVHVHFVMDEFANVALPDEFDKLLSTMRSREISVSIIIQNLAQLKKLFEKEWESIVGNCDEFLYLGGNEQSTHEYVSKLLGKETIDINTYGQSKGRNGNYSTNWQISGRELMTPDEVRMLDNKYALLFIRGERPIMDLKYDILKHPNIKLSADGGAAPYEHARPTYSVGSIRFDSELLKIEPFELTDEVGDFAVLTEEEIEEILKNEKLEEENHEENKSQKEHR